ncbi:MAG: HAD family hydrolase [Pirellulales bacterium]
MERKLEAMDALRPLFHCQSGVAPFRGGRELSRASTLPASPQSRLAVDAILFDTADVLYDATDWPRTLVRLVNHLGVAVGYDGFVGRWERDFLAEVHRGRREYDEAFQSFLLSSGLSWAQIDEIEAASRIQRSHFQREARPLSGVVRTIALLRDSGLRLAAWADSPYPAAISIERLARLGLQGMFCEVLSSFDLEAAQPDPACYRAALAALQRPADRVAYVGHDAVHLSAAQDAGFRTIAFNHRSGANADFHLAAFDDLLSLLA